MDRSQKTNLISSIRKSLLKAPFIILLHYRGLTDKQLYNFRISLKSNGIQLKIIKNTLLKVAIKDLDLDILSPYLYGPTAICYSEDPVCLSKLASNFSKENEALKIQVAYLNKSILSKDAIDSLSKLGSLEEVRSSFLNVLKGSQSRFVRILKTPTSNIVTLINNYSESK